MTSHKNHPLRKSEPGSPYCADPSCVFCKELRNALERLQREKEKQEANGHAA